MRLWAYIPLHPFFIAVFHHFGMTPRMLSSNSILFMCSSSQYVCARILPLLLNFFSFSFDLSDLIMSFIISVSGESCLFLPGIKTRQKVGWNLQCSCYHIKPTLQRATNALVSESQQLSSTQIKIDNSNTHFS